MGREVHRVCEKNRDVFHRVVGSGKFSTEVHEHSTIRCGKVEALSRRKQCTWTEVRKENQAPQTERFVFQIGGKGGGNSELLAGGHTGPPLRQGPDPWAAISTLRRYASVPLASALPVVTLRLFATRS